jgi:hypothetical protein
MNNYLKIALLLCPLAGSAQTLVKSMQTANNPDVLSMQVTGTLDGRPFRHTLRYEVAGLTQSQRDSLYQQSSRALASLGITSVPKLDSPNKANTEAGGSSVTIACADCIRKGELALYGANSVHTRKMNYNRPGATQFPLMLPLAAGNFRLVYKQRGRRPIEMPLTITEGEHKQLTLP